MNNSVEFNIIPVSIGGKQGYNIVLGQGLSSLAERFRGAVPGCGKVLLVSDSRVAGLYLGEVSSVLADAGVQVETFVFPEGEDNKTLDTLQGIYRKLAECRFQRDDCLAALGGGVVGDVTGFSAATYLRGVRFIQIPTTVLACCDSSIGGKTGVDFEGFKNYVGAFHMPSLVYMDMDFLKSLDPRQYRAGMAEAVKSALIRDLSMYSDMLQNVDRLVSGEPAMVSEIINKSCLIKKAVVEEDPTEKGVRAILNFGHTLGHSIEKLSGFSLLHGECVAIGCVLSAFISMKRSMISEGDYEGIRRLFEELGLPVTVPGELSPEDIVSTAHTDKKACGITIRFILLDGIGNGIIDRTVTDEELMASLEALKG